MLDLHPKADIWFQSNQVKKSGIKKWKAYVSRFTKTASSRGETGFERLVFSLWLCLLVEGTEGGF